MKLLLHIGLHKTGSTSIQAWLSANFNVLLDLGVLFPRAGRPGRSTSHDRLVPIARPPQKSGAETWRSERLPLWQELLDELDRHRPRQAIVSSERFWLLRPEEIELVLEATDGLQVQVLAFLRHPRTWLPSWYRQALRGGRIPASPRASFVPLDYSLRPHDRLPGWIQGVGEASVALRSFDWVTRSAPTGLITAFSDHVDGSQDPLSRTSADVVRNPSLTDSQLRACVGIRRILDPLTPGKRGRKVAQVLGRSFPLLGSILPTGLPKPLISEADEQWIDQEISAPFELYCQRHLDPRDRQILAAWKAERSSRTGL